MKYKSESSYSKSKFSLLKKDNKIFIKKNQQKQIPENLSLLINKTNLKNLRLKILKLSLQKLNS